MPTTTKAIDALLLLPDNTIRSCALPADDPLHAMYRAIGCRYVDVVQLADDLHMWLDDEGYGVQPPNPAAVHLHDLLRPHTQTYFGAALFTGGANSAGETLGISPERTDWIRRNLPR